MILWPAIRVSLIFVCIIIVSCKNPKLEGKTALKAYGGKEYKFAELPGYYVSLVMKTDHDSLREICSGAHIGDGFILTAAHCVNYLVCRSGMWVSSGINGFSIKYIRRFWRHLHGRQSSRQIGRFGIKYIAKDGVMTMGFKDIESIVYHRGYYPDEQYQHDDDLVITANDIALIKALPLEPFSKAARLPSSSEDRFGLQRIEGRLFFYGNGKHEELMKPSLHSDNSYFGGTVIVDRPSYRKPHGISHAKSPINSLGVDSSHNSLSLIINPKKEEPLSCWQHFSYPGEGYTVNRRLAIKNPRIKLKNMIKVTADYSGLHGVKKLCYGDSGGPYVYSSEKEDILVGVHSSGSDLKPGQKWCFSYGWFVNTFYQLSWIEKAKNSITIGGNHSTSKLKQ